MRNPAERQPPANSCTKVIALGPRRATRRFSSPFIFLFSTTNIKDLPFLPFRSGRRQLHRPDAPGFLMIENASVIALMART
jgi:hypothetical protein